MIPIPVTATPKSVPADYTVPNDMQGVLEAVAQYTDYEAQVSGPSIVVSTGSDAAAANASLDGLWIWMLTGGGAGAPWAPRVMSGYRNDWYQINTGKIGEIRLFDGPWTEFFDSSGNGLHNSGWEGWAICNGNNQTFNLLNHFIVPGYRYAYNPNGYAVPGSGAQPGNWITNVGCALDQPGGKGPGGGGVGPGRTFKEPYSTDYFTTIYPPARTAAEIAPLDAASGGWRLLQLAAFNFGNAGENFPGVNVDLNMQGGAHNNYELIYAGPGGVATGGQRSVAAPGPAASVQSFAGYWQYPIDQHAKMKDDVISRIPPYISVGYVQFMGYR